MKFSLGLVSAAGLVVASQLSAAAEVEIGGEYRFNLVHTDDGTKAEGSQIKETDLGVKAAKIALRGKLTDQISWNVLFQADKSALERYWVTHKVNDQLDVSIGVQKIKTYGWHRRLTSSATTPIRGAYLDLNPFKDVMAVDLTYKIAGTVSLSFIKDYFDTDAACTAAGTGCKSWNGRDVQKQPAMGFEWVGDFGEIQPLVQYTIYDRGHSSIVSAGLRFKNASVDTHVDYTLDTRNEKGVDAASGKAEDQQQKISGIAIYGEYKVDGSYSPFLHFSTLAVDQFGVEDKAEVNADGNLNNNEQTLGAGVFFENWGALYRPYVAVARLGGKYAKPNTTPTKQEDRARLDVIVGLTGKF